MKLEIITIALIFIGQMTFGQDHTTLQNNVKNQQNTLKELAMLDPSDHNDSNNIAAWELTKKQIQLNKDKIINREEEIHFYKILDTIYLEIPTPVSFSKTNH